MKILCANSNKNRIFAACCWYYTIPINYTKLNFLSPTAADYVHRFVDTIVGFDYFNV